MTVIRSRCLAFLDNQA